MFAYFAFVDQNPKYLWLDLETDGLDSAACTILECAVIVTDGSLLEIPGTAQSWVLEYGDDQRAGMSDFIRQMHTRSGLLAATPTCRDAATLDRLLEALVDAFAWTEGKPILAGACPHFDRSFLAAHCPRVDARLHYRHLDVSGFKLAFSDLAQIRYIRGFGAHRALPDIRESLASGQWLYNIWQDASLKEACDLGLFIPDELDPSEAVPEPIQRTDSNQHPAAHTGE